MIKNILSFIIIFFSFLSSNAQGTLEEIENKYHSLKITDPEYYLYSGRYAQVLFVNDKRDESFNVLNFDISNAKKNNDNSNLAFLLSIISIHHFLNKNETESKKNFEDAEKLIQKIKDNETKGYVYYVGGWLATRKGSDIIAVEYLLKSLQYYSNSKPSKTLLSRTSSVYNELASIYAKWNDFESQEKYSKKQLELAIQQNNPDAIFFANMSMGTMYEEKFKKNNENKELRNLAEAHFIEAINIYNSNNMIYASNLSYAAINLANLYLQYYPESYLPKAFEYANLGKDAALKANESNFIASIYSLLGEIALKNKETEKAEQLFKIALEELEKSLSKNLTVELTILQNLINISEITNNTEQALYYQKEYLKTYKLIFNSEIIESRKKLEIELQKQEYEKLELQAEKKEQKIQLLNFMGDQKEQEFNNLKLIKENQTKQLKLSNLESLKKINELKFFKLEAQAKNKDLINYQEKLVYKDKINNIFIGLIVSIILILLLLLFLLRQRTKGMRQKESLYKLALDKEKHNNEISTLTALLEGQELERARLARDLHDSLGGLLSATKLQLSDFYNKTTNIDKEEVRHVLEQIDYAIDKLRRVSHNLMPDLLIKFGLEIAVKEFANRMQNNNVEIDVHFLNYKTKLSQDKELFVYRIIQELVSNALKHANASEIIIQVSEDDELYNVTIEDDGKGIDLKNKNFNKSAGYHNIQSRIEFLNGKVSLRSEVNKGTTIEFNFSKK